MLDNSLAYRLHPNVRIPASVLCFHTQMALGFSLVCVTLKVKKIWKVLFFLSKWTLLKQKLSSIYVVMDVWNLMKRCSLINIKIFSPIFKMFLNQSSWYYKTKKCDCFSEWCNDSDILVLQCSFGHVESKHYFKLIAGVIICREHGFGHISLQFQKDWLILTKC